MGKKVEYTNGELIAQISKCPSGALSYRLNKKDK